MGIYVVREISRSTRLILIFFFFFYSNNFRPHAKSLLTIYVYTYIYVYMFVCCTRFRSRQFFTRCFSNIGEIRLRCRHLTGFTWTSFVYSYSICYSLFRFFYIFFIFLCKRIWAIPGSSLIPCTHKRWNAGTRATARNIIQSEQKPNPRISRADTVCDNFTSGAPPPVFYHVKP